MPLRRAIRGHGNDKRISHRLIPHKSGVHRLACIALYRNLLRQVAISPLEQTTLRTVVRHEFRSDAVLRTHLSIRASLTAGYQALGILASLRSDHVSATATAAGEASSLQSSSSVSKAAPPTKSSQTILLAKRLSDLNTHLTKLLHSYPPPTSTLATNTAPETALPSPRLTPYPGGNKILSRPLPASALTGKRHIPTLFSAGGFPALRVKKPQPPLLSKILRDKIKRRQRRTSQMIELEETAVWAREEDRWERMLEVTARLDALEGASSGSDGDGDSNHQITGKTFSQRLLQPNHGITEAGSRNGRTNGGRSIGGYEMQFDRVIEEIRGKMEAETVQQRELAARFWDIILAERKLDQEERTAARLRNSARWVEKLKVRLAKHGKVWVDKSQSGEESKAVGDGK